MQPATCAYSDLHASATAILLQAILPQAIQPQAIHYRRSIHRRSATGDPTTGDPPQAIHTDPYHPIHTGDPLQAILPQAIHTQAIYHRRSVPRRSTTGDLHHPIRYPTPSDTPDPYRRSVHTIYPTPSIQAIQLQAIHYRRSIPHPIQTHPIHTGDPLQAIHATGDPLQAIHTQAIRTPHPTHPIHTQAIHTPRHCHTPGDPYLTPSVPHPIDCTDSMRKYTSTSRHPLFYHPILFTVWLPGWVAPKPGLTCGRTSRIDVTSSGWV